MLCLVSLMISIAGVELFFRRYHRARAGFYDDVVSRRKILPYVGFSNHGHEPARRKSAGELRIFMVGGSTVEVGNPPLPVCLNAWFRKNGLDKVRVFNCGTASQVSGQDLAHLVYYILDLKPHIVVFYGGANDLFHPLVADPRPGYPYNFLIQEGNPLIKERRDYPVFSLIALSSRFLQWRFQEYFIEKFGRLTHLRREHGFATEPWREAIAETYVGNLAKARLITRAAGADFLAFFQPVAYYRKNKSPAEAWINSPEENFHMNDVREKVRSRLSRSDLGSSVHDISDVFSSDSSTVFRDPIHLNDRYNWIMADIVGERLLKIVRRRLRPTRVGPAEGRLQ